MADIRKRKKKLEDDLELLEGNFENRISSVKKNILGTLQPVSMIKKHPLKALGASVIVGFAIGILGDNKSEGEDGSGHLQKEKMANLLFNEIKRIAARKAASYLSELIDEKLFREK